MRERGRRREHRVRRRGGGRGRRKGVEERKKDTNTEKWSGLCRYISLPY